MAALPWTAAALLAAGGLAARPSTPTPPPSDPMAGPTAPVTPTVAATRAAGSGSPGALRQLSPTVELAVLAAARRTLGTAGLVAGGPSPHRWALDLRITSLHRVRDDLMIAVVHGLVIEDGDGGWDEPRPRAAAVPLRTRPVTEVVGAAWPLATAPVTTDRPAGQPVAAPDPQVVAALESLGWGVERIDAVDQITGGFLRVQVHGAPPGDTRAATHVVWLQDGPDGATPLTPPGGDGRPPGPAAPEPTAARTPATTSQELP